MWPGKDQTASWPATWWSFIPRHWWSDSVPILISRIWLCHGMCYSSVQGTCPTGPKPQRLARDQTWASLGWLKKCGISGVGGVGPCVHIVFVVFMRPWFPTSDSDPIVTRLTYLYQLGGGGEVAFPFKGALETYTNTCGQEVAAALSFLWRGIAASLEPCGVRMRDMN